MATGSSWSTAGRCCLLVLSVLKSVPASDKVPVLVWTNDPSITFPQQFAAHSISHQEFQESYVKGLTSDNEDNVVWFIGDKLKSTDFALFSDVFGPIDEVNSFRHMKSLMSEMTSVYLPRVSSPASSPADEENRDPRKVKTVHDPSEIQLDLGDDDGPCMFVVKLSELSQPPKSFSEIDELIGTVSLQLKTSARPFVAFYTANDSSENTSIPIHRPRRQTMVAYKIGSSGIFVNISDKFYFYTKNFTISVNHSSSVVTGLGVDVNRTRCRRINICVVVLMFSDIPRMAMYNASIRFELNTTEYGFWYLSKFSLEYWSVENSSSDSDMRKIEYDGDFVEETPVGYSYHCSNLPNMTVKAKPRSSQAVPLIKFSHFQIQAFVTKKGHFGHYNDCVGFFTSGIWMSLITSAILIAILFFGVIMMLNISTQDQFSSVHGNTLTITVSDG